MKLLGLTQRVENIKQYHERRDCLDQRWSALAYALGFLPVPLPNVPASEAGKLAESLNLNAIILTGGNSLTTAPERDAFEIALLDWSRHKKIPIVGVCRGLQMINHYFGGNLSAIEGHVATRHFIEFKGCWEKHSTREVNSFHDWGVFKSNLAKDLEVLATHSDGSIEALAHPQEKITGIMWHPEREKKFESADLELLKGLLL